MESTRLDDTVLALLFASDEPLTPNRICSVLDGVSVTDVRSSLSRLEERFGAEGAAIRLEHVAGGYQLCTNPAYSDYVARLYRGRRKQKLSKAAMEALAIIAYRQPVTRADIETVRGVACGGVITTLMERSLIRIVGKARVLGGPFLYGTTQEFLEYLGLNALGDLPSLEDLEALLEREAASESSEDAHESESGETERSVDSDDSLADYAEESIVSDPSREEPRGVEDGVEETLGPSPDNEGADLDDEGER